MVYNTHLLENSDLLEFVEEQLNTNNVKTITDTEMAISLYEFQRFMIEQDTHVFMELNYGFVNEDAKEVAKKVWESIKKIFQRIIDLLGKVKDYVFGIKNRLKVLKEKLDAKIQAKKYSKSEMLVLKNAMKANPDLELTKIVVSKEALNFVESYVPLSKCQTLSTVISAIGEYVKFCMSNKDGNFEDGAFEKNCPSFAKIEKMCNGDKDSLLSMICKEANLPENMESETEHINISEKCNIKEFANKYYQNASKLERAAASNINKDDDTDFNKVLTQQFEQLKKVNQSTELYKDTSISLMKLITSVMTVIQFRSKLYMGILAACAAFCQNMIKCCEATE